MKKMSIALLIIIACFSCQQEENIIQFPSSDLLLTTITINHPGSSWMEHYTYNESNQLVTVQEGFESGYHYELKYDRDNLNEIHIYGQSGLFTKQLIEYNSLNQIERVKDYRVLENGAESIRYTYNYSYKSNGLLKEKAYHIADSEVPERTHKYTWKNGNIVKEKEYAKNGELNYEAFYEYDEERNYQQFQRHQINELNWRNNNNMLKLSYKYHNGYWADSICPCLTTVTDYNEANFPTKFTFNELSTFELKYE